MGMQRNHVATMLAKTRELRFLVALAEHRNLRKAASELHITQPAASRTLKMLEELTGVTLFERLSAEMLPTKYGEVMVRRARVALSRLDAAQEDILKLKCGQRGRVEVGVVMSAAMSLMPRAVARLKCHVPGLCISVHEASGDVLMERLERRQLDFIVGPEPEGLSMPELVFEEIGGESAGIGVRPGHPLLDGRTFGLADLVEMPWVLPPRGSVLRVSFEDMFRRAGLDAPMNVVDTTALLVAIALMRHMDALHVLPLEVARYYASLDVMRILPIDLPLRMESLGIVCRARELSPGAMLLADAVRVAALEAHRWKSSLPDNMRPGAASSGLQHESARP